MTETTRDRAMWIKNLNHGSADGVDRNKYKMVDVLVEQQAEIERLREALEWSKPYVARIRDTERIDKALKAIDAELSMKNDENQTKENPKCENTGKSNLDELKHCPFCGGEDLRVADPKGNPAHESWVLCRSCNSSAGLANSKSEAIKAWNTRASQQVDELQIICAEAYQVVGSFMDFLPDEKILDNLSQQKLVHKDVLPFSPTIDDAMVERCAGAIHKGLGGNGWAYSNYNDNELIDCNDELLNAAKACLKAAMEDNNG